MMQSLPKVWKWVLGILILLNIISLALLWMRPQPPGGHPESPESMAAYFQKELGLDEAQKDAFTTAINEHRDAVRKLHESKRSYKDQMFLAMTASPQDSATVNLFAEKAAAVERDMDLLLAQHFRDLQAICKGEQKERLGALFQGSIPKPPMPPGKRPD